MFFSEEALSPGSWGGAGDCGHSHTTLIHTHNTQPHNIFTPLYPLFHTHTLTCCHTQVSSTIHLHRSYVFTLSPLCTLLAYTFTPKPGFHSPYVFTCMHTHVVLHDHVQSLFTFTLTPSHSLQAPGDTHPACIHMHVPTLSFFYPWRSGGHKKPFRPQ